MTRFGYKETNQSLQSPKHHVLQKLEITGPLGTQSILIPVDFELDISVKNLLERFPLGGNQHSLPPVNRVKQTITISIIAGFLREETALPFLPIGEDAKRERDTKQMFGTLRALVLQMLTGVSVGFTSHISLRGVGYKGFLDNNVLSLNIGFGHPVQVSLPNNIHIDPLKIINTSQGSTIPVFSNSLTDLHNFVYNIYKIRPTHKSLKETGIKIINIKNNNSSH